MLYSEDPLRDPTGRTACRPRELATARARSRQLRMRLRSDAKNRPTQLHHGATRSTVAPMPSPYPAARIAVDAGMWRAFRQAAIVRGIPVSVYLARLVEAELSRRDATPIGDVD